MRLSAAGSQSSSSEPLIIFESGDTLMVTDVTGDTAAMTIPDVCQSNGVIMVIDKVLMP